MAAINRINAKIWARHREMRDLSERRRLAEALQSAIATIYDEMVRDM
jgi:hypothetical protein